MKKFLLIIHGDTNDADYTSRTCEIDESELKELLPIIQAIKDYSSNKANQKWGVIHNWTNNEYATLEEYPCTIYKDILTEDQIEMFSDYVPYDIHTIVSITLYEMVGEKQLLFHN
jgi:hypothetical protein